MCNIYAYNVNLAIFWRFFKTEVMHSFSMTGEIGFTFDSSEGLEIVKSVAVHYVALVADVFTSELYGFVGR